MEHYLKRAKELGFTSAAIIDVSDIAPSLDIRALCAPDKCSSYSTNWVCPPGCGSFKLCCEKLHRYTHGLLLQTKFDGSASFSLEESAKLSLLHSAHVTALRDEILSSFPNALTLSTGGCNECENCTFPDNPCRKPEINRGSLSAFGIDVGDLCKKYDFEFEFTNGTLYFVACILTD